MNWSQKFQIFSVACACHIYFILTFLFKNFILSQLAIINLYVFQFHLPIIILSSVWFWSVASFFKIIVVKSFLEFWIIELFCFFFFIERSTYLKFVYIRFHSICKISCWNIRRFHSLFFECFPIETFKPWMFFDFLTSFEANSRLWI